MTLYKLPICINPFSLKWIRNNTLYSQITSNWTKTCTGGGQGERNTRKIHCLTTHHCVNWYAAKSFCVLKKGELGMHARERANFGGVSGKEAMAGGTYSIDVLSSGDKRRAKRHTQMIIKKSKKCWSIAELVHWKRGEEHSEKNQSHSGRQGKESSLENCIFSCGKNAGKRLLSKSDIHSYLDSCFLASSPRFPCCCQELITSNQVRCKRTMASRWASYNPWWVVHGREREFSLGKGAGGEDRRRKAASARCLWLLLLEWGNESESLVLSSTMCVHSWARLTMHTMFLCALKLQRPGGKALFLLP